MSIVSINFLIFIVIVFLIYFLSPGKYRWIVLLFFSYLFYAVNDFKMLIYLVVTTCTVFFGAIWLNKTKGRIRQRIFIIIILINFGILAFLKYSLFLSQSVNVLLNKLSLPMVLPGYNLLLPLGISFYIFQSVGYLVDVYRNKYPAEKNWGRFALFVSFFPQIIQGPISRFDQLANQLFRPNKFNYEQMLYGFQLIMWGFFKKLLVADRAALLVNAVLPNYADYRGWEVGVAVFAYMIQIYTDFSGGIDVARGVAQCLGIHMAENFRRPYFAISISDYWQRWHITLGTWMRDYLLYSLTFSKRFGRINKWARKVFGNYFGKMLPTCLAMALVFLVVGIWHGAGWKYIVFGLYNGGLIVIGILLTEPIRRWRVKFPGWNAGNPAVRVLLIIGTGFLVFIGKYLSAAQSFSHAAKLLISTFSVFNPLAIGREYFERVGITENQMVILLFGIIILFVVSFCQEKGIRVREYLAGRHIVWRWLAYYVVLLAVILFGFTEASTGSFLYEHF